MKYFNNKAWAHITREERYFCAELFFELRENPKPFFELIEKKAEVFEIAYEVCLYRDILKAYGKSIKASSLPQKRTFDLALFSENEIIIIEAKANTGFNNKQLDSFNEEVANIKSLFKLLGHKTPKISTIAIFSSKYTPKPETVKNFIKTITWKELAKLYPSKKELFISADNTYND